MKSFVDTFLLPDPEPVYSRSGSSKKNGPDPHPCSKVPPRVQSSSTFTFFDISVPVPYLIQNSWPGPGVRDAGLTVPLFLLILMSEE